MIPTSVGTLCKLTLAASVRPQMLWGMRPQRYCDYWGSSSTTRDQMQTIIDRADAHRRLS
jgi:hypothetical protein